MDGENKAITTKKKKKKKKKILVLSRFEWPLYTGFTVFRLISLTVFLMAGSCICFLEIVLELLTSKELTFLLSLTILLE